MPKLTKDFPITIVFRARESDGKKLAALAELTGRGQGEVLRLLLKQAVLAEAPDIRVGEPLRMAMSAEVGEEHVN
jgi:hypothetical protein